MSLPDQLLGQVGNDPFGTAVEFGRAAFNQRRNLGDPHRRVLLDAGPADERQRHSLNRRDGNSFRRRRERGKSPPMAAEHLGKEEHEKRRGHGPQAFAHSQRSARKLPNAKNHRRMRSGATRPHLRNHVDSIVCPQWQTRTAAAAISDGKL